MLLVGIPSKTNNGLLPPRIEFEPLIIMDDVPPGLFEFWVINTPAALPLSNSEISDVGWVIASSVLTTVTDPTISLLF